MSISRTKALEYAYELISVPRAHLRVHLKQTKEGVSLRYRGRVMTKVYMNRSGMNAASAMAQALGVPIPKLGESVSALVSTGTLYRVLALSELDYQKARVIRSRREADRRRNRPARRCQGRHMTARDCPRGQVLIKSADG